MASVRRPLGLALAALAVIGLGAQQRATPPPEPPAVAGTGTISGVVVDSSTGAPIAGAVVYLGPPNQKTGQPRRVLTDDRGRFVFMHLGPLPAGYSLGANKTGYLSGSSGPGVGAASSRIPLGDGEWFAAAKIVLSRPSAAQEACPSELT